MDGSPLLRSESVNTPCVCVCVCGGEGRGSLALTLQLESLPPFRQPPTHRQTQTVTTLTTIIFTSQAVKPTLQPAPAPFPSGTALWAGETTMLRRRPGARATTCWTGWARNRDRARSVVSPLAALPPSGPPTTPATLATASSTRECMGHVAPSFLSLLSLRVVSGGGVGVGGGGNRGPRRRGKRETVANATLSPPELRWAAVWTCFIDSHCGRTKTH